MKKLFTNIMLWLTNLVYATKNTETQLLTQSGADSVEGPSVTQDVNQYSNQLSKALMKGELTEEVKQLRYRTYKIDREAKKYKYFAPTLALKKKEGKDNKFISYDKSDGLDVITIQYNYALSEGVLAAMHQVEDGQMRKELYKIKLYRDFTPRFVAEEFLKKIVVKRFDETHAILDLYFSKYPERFFRTSNDKSFRSKAFIHEIERVMKDKVRSDILDIAGISFVTNHAYKQEDLLEYSFRNVVYKEAVEFDGNYILRFKASIEKDGHDLTAAYYNAAMDEKYKNKERKEVCAEYVFGDVPVETYTCADCGKVITFDVKKMDEMPIFEAREIDEDIVEDNGWSVTEYMDMQIVEQTIGKKLCKECLKKYLDNREKEL